MSLMSHTDENRESPSVPLLLNSGRIFTVDELHPTVTAVLGFAGRIQHVGTDDELFSLVESDTKVVDVKGGFITPGFIDAHVQPVYGGMERNACDMTAAESYLDTIKSDQNNVEEREARQDGIAEWIIRET